MLRWNVMWNIIYLLFQHEHKLIMVHHANL